jgi:hypothetical protein
MNLRRVPLLLALVAVLALFALVFVRWGKARVVAELQGKLLAPPVGEGRTVAWLERRADEDALMLKQGRARPRELLTGAALGGLALEEDDAFVTRQESQESAPRFFALDLPSGGQKDLFALPGLAKQIVVGEKWICWLSETPAALPAAPHVVAGGPVTALWAMSHRRDKQQVVRLLSCFGGADLLGESGEQVYWAERDGQTFRVYRQKIGDSLRQPLASERGARSALLLADRIAWTAPSQEAASTEQYCSVKARPLSSGDPTVIADWLQPNAALLRSGDTLYAQERDRLWQLGEGRGEQRTRYHASLGGQHPAVVGGIEYLVAQEQGKTRLVRRGLTWSGRLRVMVGR